MKTQNVAIPKLDPAHLRSVEAYYKSRSSQFAAAVGIAREKVEALEMEKPTPVL